jgi:uncharacterized membrane protein YphA (DoxX/SURF4 family)
MKIVREIARVLVGGLFIFSGLIKLNDPVGTAIKLEEYFQVFSQDFAPFFENLVPAALFLAVFLSVLEVVLGIAVLLAYRMAATSITLIAMIIFFTGLTFYSAYFNKVTDCGCFGDAIKLTPWQSFYKDVILVVLIVVVFMNYQKYKPILKAGLGNGVMLGATLLSTLIALLSIWYLPFIDFRSYKVGNYLPDLMRPEAAARYQYIMVKDGEEYTFESYPTDPGYELVDAVLLNPDQVEPKIPDFGVWNDDGDYTIEILTGSKLIFIFHNVNKTNTKNIELMKDLAVAANVETWILTSAGYEEIESFRHENQMGFPIYFGDATVLKAMIRSNPGIMLMKDGTVMGKWHFNSVPNSAEIRSLLQ